MRSKQRNLLLIQKLKDYDRALINSEPSIQMIVWNVRENACEEVLGGMRNVGG